MTAGMIRRRLGSYIPEPSEHVLRPWVTSSLFPYLRSGSRNPFRVCLVLLLTLLVGSALLRWQAPMIAIAAAGLPLLYVSYIREIAGRRGVPVRRLLLTAAIGVALGIGWAYAAGTVFAEGYDVALGFETVAGPNVASAVVISIIEALLMFVPAVVMRIADGADRAPLDGHLIGACGATAFTAAATTTLLAPQLATGVIAHHGSFAEILVEAGVEGVAMPITSAAVGGMFGAALWFPPSADASRRKSRFVLATVAVAVVLFSGFGLLDVSPFSNDVYVAGYLLIAAVMVLAMRIAVQAALEHEAGDRAYDDGIPLRHTTYPRVLGIACAGVAVTVAAAIVVSIRLTPGIAPYVCPPECGRPPIGAPVETNPRFTADDGAFTVNYPGEGTAYRARFEPNGVVLDYLGGDTGVLALLGEPAADRTPKDITLETIKDKYPDATVAYEIPNAMVGYQPGYGVAADVYPLDSRGKYDRLRVLVMVAVKNDYALIAAAVGPYHEFSPDYGAGHPSAANLELAMDMGKYVNSFTWSADRYGHGY